MRTISCKASSSEIATSVEKFRVDHQAWILVCDRSGEEGLNLQFAHGILHIDLPFSASRIEQRIGRLDRFGRKKDRLLHRVMLPDDDEDAAWSAWFGILANGFRIFNRSISDVQFKLEEIDTRISKILFEKGPLGLRELEDAIDEELKVERRKLDEQHALDDLAFLGDDAEELVDEIDESEYDEVGIFNNINPWFWDVLKLGQSPPMPKLSIPCQIYWHPHTQIPEFPWEYTFEPAFEHPSTWSRRQSLKISTERVMLLRPGSILFSALEGVAQWDDRGTAYATWRTESSFLSMVRSFRLVWVVEPSISDATPIWSIGNQEHLKRRAESYLPISTYEQFLDEMGNEIKNLTLLKILKLDYQSKQNSTQRLDFNLGSRPDFMNLAMDPELFYETVGQVRQSGEVLLRTDAKYQELRNSALDKFRRSELRARRSLEQRSIHWRMENGTKLPGFEQEIETLDRIRFAIEVPKIRLDEIGFICVSPEIPST